MSIKPFLYGKYVILDRVAVGGMAEVFRAQTFGVHGFQRLLVIKRILPHLSKDEEFVDMFIDEAKIAVGLTHANICQVTDLGKIDDNYFIAMEYVNGKDLRAILKKCYNNKTPLGVEQSIFIASEMCKGLDYAHRREDPITGQSMSVIHRDISPQNVMVSYHGEIKIVDFGIAKTEFKIHKTQAGVLKGKFAYMSPEQSSGLELSPATDIFSAGIILYEMLTNRRLFLGGTDFETLENIKRCEIPSIREINPKVTKELEAVVMKSLAKKPENRFQTANQMHNALSKILYTEYPHFTQDHLSKKLYILFEDDIKKETEALKRAIDSVGAAQAEQAQIASDNEISQKHTRTEKEEKSTFFLLPWLLALWAFLLRFRYPLLFILIAALTALFGKMLFSGKEEAPKQEVKQEMPEVRTFVFETTPPKAKISINGDPKGETPLNLPLALNKHFDLSLEKEGYQPIKKEILTSPDNLHYVFEMTQNKPVFGAVKIDTNPSGAKVTVNGKDTGQTTPAIIDELPFEKDAEIGLSKEGYLPYTKTVSINQVSQDMKVSLKKKGPTLKINVIPSNATIFLNKKSYGKVITDLTKNQTYTLRIESKGYLPEERKIKIDGDLLELDIELKKKETQTGSISISATPWATVVIDGKIIGTSPILNYSLGVGKHDVIFRHPDFPDVTKSINIKYNDTQKLIIDLRQESEK